MQDRTPKIGFLLHDVARLMRKRFEQHARSLGLTRAQWQVLVHLAEREGIHQSGLAEILEVEPITLLRILDKLEARNLIERRRHATDRRIWLLYLQPEAHPLLAELREYGSEVRGEAFSSIPDQDRERLQDTLLVVKANLLRACATPPLVKKEAVGG